MTKKAEREGDNKKKLQALSQINQVEAQKIEIVSNLGIVDSVVGAAEQKQQAPDLSDPTTREEEEPEENTECQNFGTRENTDRPNKVCREEEDSAPATRARAIPVDDSGED